MAKIVSADSEFITVRLNSGKTKIYSIDCFDWDPVPGQEVAFTHDSDGNIFIELKDNVEFVRVNEPAEETHTFPPVHEAPAQEVPSRRSKKAAEAEPAKKPEPVKKPEPTVKKTETPSKPIWKNPFLPLVGLAFGILALISIFLPASKLLLLPGLLAAVCGVCGLLNKLNRPFSVAAVALGVFSFVFLTLFKGTEMFSHNTPKATPTPATETAAPTPTPEPAKAEYSLGNPNLGYYAYGGSTVYDAIIPVTNTGSTAIALGTGSTLVLNDNAGNTVFTDTSLRMAPAVLEPGETGYLFNAAGSAIADTIINSDTLSADLQVNLLPCEAYTKYSVSETNFGLDAIGYPLITGTLTNASGKTGTDIAVQAVFTDPAGNVIGVSETMITSLPSGSSQTFEIDANDLPGSFISAGVAEYEVYARTIGK